MSHVGATPIAGAPKPTPRTSWRFFPHATMLALGAVIAVNGVLAWAALSTFPGLAVEDEFDKSNNYDQVLDTAQRQAALGWVLDARVEAGRPVLFLAGHDGHPLESATIAAIAQRPLGPRETTHPRFAPAGGGFYRADTALAPAGQWELLLSVVADGKVLNATRRIVVR